MIRYCSPLVAIAALCSLAGAQTGYSITGGLSNFDCTNHCDDPCDEFEIEIEGIHPEDVVHCYRNGNYGSPTVTLSPDGTFTIIDYRNPGHLTAINTIEHFGVSLKSLNVAAPIRVRWMKNGKPATVNGQVPTPGGSTPASQPLLPSISAEMGYGGIVGDIATTVTNNDALQSIWIKRSATLTTGLVTLEALMTNDPVVTSAIPIDTYPVLLGPGQSIVYSSDLIEVEDNQSVVFATEYFQDLSVGGPFSSWHNVGARLGNIMTASLAGPEASCSFYSPVFTLEPQNADGPEGSTVNLRSQADGNDMDITYQWMKDGVDLVDSPMYRGVDTDELSIEEITFDSEGFYSVRVSNACGSSVSRSALVFVTGHNVPPTWAVDTCPAVADQPVSNSTCPAGTILTTSATGAGPFTYHWQCVGSDGTSCGDLIDGTFVDPATGQSFDVFGSDSTTLYITNVHVGAGSNQLRFAARVTNACAEVTSNAATVTVCAADFTCDTMVDDLDFGVFASAYDLLLCSDSAMDVSCPADINADGMVDDSDFALFAGAYDTLICP